MDGELPKSLECVDAFPLHDFLCFSFHRFAFIHISLEHEPMEADLLRVTMDKIRTNMDKNGDGLISLAEWAQWHERWIVAGKPPMAKYLASPSRLEEDHAAVLQLPGNSGK